LDQYTWKRLLLVLAALCLLACFAVAAETPMELYEELMENLRITTLLKKELKVPFLYLSGGTHSKLHRMIGAQLGCVTYLAVQMHDERAVPTQPTIRAAKAVRDHLDYLPDLPM
jgi:hypothetical protein